MAQSSEDKKVPVSAPELSEQDKERLEASLRVDHDKPGAGSGKETDELEEAWKRPDVIVGGSAAKPVVAPVGPLPKHSASQTPGDNPFKRFFAGYWHRKAWSLPLTLLAIIGLLAAVPFTRYALAAVVVSQPVTVTVVDQSTQKPVSSAEVSLAGKSARTDSKGVAKFSKVKVGDQKLTVTKKYYKTVSQELFVDLSKAKSQQLAIAATGRLVPVSVVNKISGKPLENVTLKASGTEVKTDKDGKAIIVLPADRPDLPITLSNGGYNALEARVKVTDQTVKENAFALVPAGKLYFLSRASGKIDVVKTDLDGTNRATVAQGTGKEEDRNTILLASRDWKYLALYSKRDSGLPKLYLVDTSNDKLTVMDEGEATFALSGWSGHDFVYNVVRNKVQEGEANRQALKSFNADKKQLITIDQNTAEKADNNQTTYQSFSNFNLLRDTIVYTVIWTKRDCSSSYGCSYGGTVSGRSHIIRSAAAGSTNRKDVKAFPSDKFGYIRMRPYGADELYIATDTQTNNVYKQEYYEFEDNQVKSIDLDDGKFDDAYPTYLASPDNSKTFWNEERDGKQNFYVGDAGGENGKQRTIIDEGQVYGWYGNDYLLASKKGSELYIMPVGGGEPFKVADYHKPQLSYRGYGGGYGGL